MRGRGGRMKSPYETDGFGVCIYCNTPGTPEELTNEHIVPQGLGGKRYIKDASCLKCQLETHRFETAALEGFLWPARTHAGVKPSRPSRVQRSLPVWVQRPSVLGGSVFHRSRMPTEKHPYVIAMPA